MLKKLFLTENDFFYVNNEKRSLIFANKSTHDPHLKRNRAAVSRNRYDAEKTVDTHKILINAMQFYVCLHEI
jgi:hypothetical protein